MKVFRGDGCCDNFEPYDVTITVETKADQELLRDITHANCSVPAAVVSYKGKDHDRYSRTSRFLSSLQKALKGSNC